MQLRADRGGLGPSSCIAGQIAVQPGPGAPSGASVPWLQHGFSAGTRSRPRPLSPCARSSRHPSHVDFFAGDRPRTLNTPQPCWQAVSFSLPPIARWVPSPAAPALPHSSHPRTHARALGPPQQHAAQPFASFIFTALLSAAYSCFRSRLLNICAATARQIITARRLQVVRRAERAAR